MKTGLIKVVTVDMADLLANTCSDECEGAADQIREWWDLYSEFSMGDTEPVLATEHLRLIAMKHEGNPLTEDQEFSLDLLGEPPVEVQRAAKHLLAGDYVSLVDA